MRSDLAQVDQASEARNATLLGPVEPAPVRVPRCKRRISRLTTGASRLAPCSVLLVPRRRLRWTQLRRLVKVDGEDPVALDVATLLDDLEHTTQCTRKSEKCARLQWRTRAQCEPRSTTCCSRLSNVKKKPRSTACASCSRPRSKSESSRACTVSVHLRTPYKRGAPHGAAQRAPQRFTAALHRS
jgi:hypothetical protein